MRRGLSNYVTVLLLFLAVMLTLLPPDALSSQDKPAESKAPAAAASADTEKEESIASAQEGLAMRYQRFESTMLQVAEYLRKTDPERADLLVRAIGKSKETRLPDQFRQLVELLKQEQLGDALEEQENVVTLMRGLLDLLQSEDRKDEIEKEKARIRELIKDVNRLIDIQTDVRSATERKENPQGLEKKQNKLAGDAQKVVDKIDVQDAAKAAAKAAQGKSGKSQSGKDGKKSDSKKPDKDGKDAKKDGESKDGDAKDDESKDDESKDGDEPKDDKDGDKKDGDSKDDKEGESKSGKDGQKGKDGPQGKDGGKPKDGEQPEEGDQPKDDAQSPSEGEPQESKDGEKGKPKPGKGGKPQPGQPSKPPESEDDPQQDQPSADQQQNDAPSQQQKTPGRDELQRAKQDMERAIEELKKKNHGKASDEQDKALAELTKAKEKLEEILRQLREEERDLLLAALEARFRDMLARQLVIYNGTVGLHAVPEAQRTDRHRNRSVELARGEEEISLLAAKALTLLKEEGSSIAFPEAVEQMRDDMLTVVSRLERFDVADLTQAIEKDIIEALEELIEALQKEMEKSKDQKQNPPPQEGQPQDPALIDQLAELKTLRALQYRVNRRTKVLGREVEGEQAVDPDVVKQLREQARRQEKIQKATYDLSTGKNK